MLFHFDISQWNTTAIYKEGKVTDSHSTGKDTVFSAQLLPNNGRSIHIS